MHHGLSLLIYKGHKQSLWTHLITPSQNFVLCPLLKNDLQTIDHFKTSCLKAPFLWLEKPRNHMGQNLNFCYQL